VQTLVTAIRAALDETGPPAERVAEALRAHLSAPARA
jgi:hypothetical protein